MNRSSVTPSPGSRTRMPSPGVWLHRMTTLAGVLALCAATTVSAAPAATAGRAHAGGGAGLYASDYTGDAVLRLPAGGGPQRTVPATGLTRPTGITLDPSGDLYVSDTGNNRVLRLPADGGPQTTVPTTGLNRPIGLALDADGDLYIADSFNDRVVRVPAGGGPQTTVPTSGLTHPDGLALDAEGALYIADFVNDRVVEVPAGGGRQRTVRLTGISQPTGLAFDTAGSLYVASSGNDKVVKARPGGGRQTTVPTRGLNGPQGLAVDGSGNLFVADFGNDRVVTVRAHGGGQTTVPFTGLHTPVGVATRPARERTRLAAARATGQQFFRPPVLRISGLAATLTTTHGRPLPGRKVTFTTVDRTRRLCAAVTDGRGRSRCEVTVRRDARLYEELRRHGYLATFTGSGRYLPSADTAPVRAGRRHRR
ncbi:SMP-30/gluconolactonase/LRE family protein [Streptomyces sp. LN785]|uniref:SMP-30/gluconolactonase/LRE family protein n=1 Tax=Streptomyces sp. LN785 TaxID=3112983 RepID=UPI00371E78E8